jgi:putative addiction module component (TIGR02574 family)
MGNMSVKERRDKLLEQFQDIIQDEQRMEQLEMLFQGMLDSEESILSTEQWEEVERRSADYKSGKISGSSWEDVKKNIRSKYAV